MCVLCFLLRLFSVCVCNSSQCVCGQVASGLHCFVISVCGWYSEHVCICGVKCLPHACCPRGVCACPSGTGVLSLCGVCEQVGLHSVPTCGPEVTSVCETAAWVSILHCCFGVSVECVFTFMGSCMCRAVCALVSPGQGASCVPSEATWRPKQHAWRPLCRLEAGCVCGRARRPASAVGPGLAVAGRAGQGLWWALDPRPDLREYKYLELLAAVFTRPQSEW